MIVDFYCCEGGASAGYAAAGFSVVGVDRDPQPRYPFPFLQMDALEAMDRLLAGEWLTFHTKNGMPLFAHISLMAAWVGSPPCQARTKAQKIQGREHPLLIAPTRERFIRSGLPYVIENVVPDGFDPDPLMDPVLLCGEMFEIETYRHRLFERTSIWKHRSTRSTWRGRQRWGADQCLVSTCTSSATSPASIADAR
ncbi:hypothetical protein SCB71_06425 [Herbiconiux sp. KACC 21604]|uniref:hypothetical protein n=1 Tax=unclassified Herbiconiux TaxID=2618217 RepID=UPI001C1249F6|nr:hypothetical protein [Herbiconiux sp. SALV-R1]WPO87874.1 hypothetical protein SCB71_06425 [Herbiconiux sp. KACC 21604]